MDNQTELKQRQTDGQGETLKSLVKSILAKRASQTELKQRQTESEKKLFDGEQICLKDQTAANDRIRQFFEYEERGPFYPAGTEWIV